MALACTKEPSQASIKTQHVINKDLAESPTAVFDTTDEVPAVSAEGDEWSLCSRCSKV